MSLSINAHPALKVSSAPIWFGNTQRNWGKGSHHPQRPRTYRGGMGQTEQPKPDYSELYGILRNRDWETWLLTRFQAFPPTFVQLHYARVYQACKEPTGVCKPDDQATILTYRPSLAQLATNQLVQDLETVHRSLTGQPVDIPLQDSRRLQFLETHFAHLVGWSTGNPTQSPPIPVDQGASYLELLAVYFDHSLSLWLNQPAQTAPRTQPNRRPKPTASA